LKLEEAKFFLDLAGKSQDDVKVFGFFINAFFAAAASIRVDNGVMAYRYRKVEDFYDWLKEPDDKLNVDFSYQFWIIKTRKGIIHREETSMENFADRLLQLSDCSQTKTAVCPLFEMTLSPTTDCVLLRGLTRRKEEKSHCREMQ